ncbi:MAG: ISL3 family transposase [Leptolyngbya sp. Prado105]|jgi:transposase|nr:ISL3 family transposase [Leptolyngbya sp. Prado105]
MVINRIGEIVDILTHLLPSQEHLELQSYELDPKHRQVQVFVDSVQQFVRCPVCDHTAHRVHSHYERTLADLPWADYRLIIKLTVGKFFCDQMGCDRKIFTERIAEVMAPWARRTQRLAAQLSEIALYTGGEGGAKLSQKLHCPVSQNTLLSLISRQSMPAVSTPKALGVDDFAFRRGQRYGTILVDLETNRPIVLLPDREAETLAEWLKDHPGIEILSRDRSKTYRQGMTKGAPNATQVADRFHLLKNLAEVLERILAMHTQQLKAVETAQIPVNDAIPIAPVAPRPAIQERSARMRERRFAKYEQVHQLRQQGWEILEIARHLGMGKRTVYRYLSHSEFPEWQAHPGRGRSQRSQLDRYKPYVLEQWNQGQQNTKRLFKEIQQQGYRGSYQTVARYTRRLRQAQRQYRAQLGAQPQLPIRDLQQPPLTARRATWMVMRRADQRTDVEQVLIADLKTQHPDLAAAIDLTQGFTKLVRERLAEQLDVWLEQALSSSMKLFQGFAQGLKEDYAAVKASLMTDISNGPVEGNINRLKLLKRQMYGRASFDLLNRRFILTS